MQSGKEDMGAAAFYVKTSSGRGVLELCLV